jgi:hypothetical protein
MKIAHRNIRRAWCGIICILMVALDVTGLGFEGYYTDVDPIPCATITTFESQGSYLRDVYVATSGSEAGDGSMTNPYRTLTAATTNAIPGDIIHVSGTHPGGISIANLRGTAEHPIQIVGDSAFQGGANCIQFSRCAYLVLRNLTCSGGTYNGFNVDDGSAYTDPTATHHIVFDSLHIYNIGTGGNNDNLKLSGLTDFYVLNSHFHDSSAGSGIDMVGCHDGIIAYNRMEDMGTNFMQVKGGSRNITIHGNILRGAVDRGLNMGGSTGEQYFRPPLSEMADPYEARHIRATANIISDVEAGIAFVGCDECLAANNVFYKPGRWVLRILQESVSLGGRTAIPSRRGEFDNNIVVVDSGLSAITNIGPSTESSSFRFSHNLWYHATDPSFSPTLPTQEIGGVVASPLFSDEGSLDFHLTEASPVRGLAETSWARADADAQCFSGEAGAYAYNGDGTSCAPAWQCTSWSACSVGQQTRTCTDSNACGSTTGRPAESQNCTLSCIHAADNYPCDGTISASELMQYIFLWKRGMAISLIQLMEAIRLWKG